MGYGTGSGVNGIIVGGVAGFLTVTVIIVALVVVAALAINRFMKLK